MNTADVIQGLSVHAAYHSFFFFFHHQHQARSRLLEKGQRHMRLVQSRNPSPMLLVVVRCVMLHTPSRCEAEAKQAENSNNPNPNPRSGPKKAWVEKLLEKT
jgi:hypothetical protein